MASVESAIRQHLANDATVAALVGTRIHHGTAPKSSRDAGPYIVFAAVGGRPIAHLGNTSGIALVVYQFDAWSDDATEAYSIQEAIRLAWPAPNLGRGTLGSGGNTVVARRVIPSGGPQTDSVDSPVGSEEMLHRRTQDYELIYEETAPS